MSDHNEHSRKVEEGHEKAIQELTVERDQLQTELSRLRTELTDLKRALDQEVRDKATIAAERDLYLQHLQSFWAKEIADMDKNGIPFGDIIAEIEDDLRARGKFDAQ